LRQHPRYSSIRRLTIAAIAVGAVLASTAAGAKTAEEALKEGRLSFDARYRYERVKDDNFDLDALASTLRVRLGYTTGTLFSFFAGIQFEGLVALGNESYNSTANGKNQYPVIADPEDVEVNRVFVGYEAPAKTTLKLGRQKITLNNHRHIGNVGWRQLEQTFDAFSVVSTGVEKLNLFYGHLERVNRIFGEHNPKSALARLDVNSDLINVIWDSGVGKLVGYAYFIEFEDTPLLSQKNFGVRFTGAQPLGEKYRVLYGAELVQQDGYKDAASFVDAQYYFLEVGFDLDVLTIKGTYELLGGDGVYGFRTPLATLYKFQGWADAFLETPKTGVEDLQATLSADAWGLNWIAAYHDFNADEGGADYGSEVDLSIGKKFGKTVSLGLRYASYDADEFFRDVEKIWFWAQFVK
jgi:hypothetical protein